MYSKIIVLNKDLVKFLNLTTNYRTLYDLKMFIISNTKCNISNNIIELSEAYKVFFSISTDTIHITSLLNIIMLKYNTFNNLPSKIQYNHYYQNPINVNELYYK
jgi:hypothetical protein